mmetsp:Transcript_64091/g.150213  ORF Transcript_64091/g.150213 Transcript_64091/m.150213 type:complete len:244 (-) Transcript_64091:2406-3137(-)
MPLPLSRALGYGGESTLAEHGPLHTSHYPSFDDAQDDRIGHGEVRWHRGAQSCRGSARDEDQQSIRQPISVVGSQLIGQTALQRRRWHGDTHILLPEEGDSPQRDRMRQGAHQGEHNLLCTWNHAGSGNSEGLLQSRIIPQQGFCILGVQGVAPRRCGHLRHLNPDALAHEVGPLGAIDLPGPINELGLVQPRKQHRLHSQLPAANGSYSFGPLLVCQVAKEVACGPCRLLHDDLVFRTPYPQ